MVVSPVVSLSCPQLPLAVYREIQAHLHQLPGVTVELLAPISGPFEYLASQVGGIKIQIPESLSTQDTQYLQQILDYYAQQFGAWQPYGEN